MRPFQKVRFPDPPWLVLLTSESVEAQSPILAADFRDTHGLFHPTPGRFVGYAADGTMQLGKLPLQLVDGVWYLERDEIVSGRFKNLSSSDLVLRTIAS